MIRIDNLNGEKKIAIRMSYRIRVLVIYYRLSVVGAKAKQAAVFPFEYLHCALKHMSRSMHQVHVNKWLERQKTLEIKIQLKDFKNLNAINRLFGSKIFK